MWRLGMIHCCPVQKSYPAARLLASPATASMAVSTFLTSPCWGVPWPLWSSCFFLSSHCSNLKTCAMKLPGTEVLKSLASNEVHPKIRGLNWGLWLGILYPNLGWCKWLGMVYYYYYYYYYDYHWVNRIKQFCSQVGKRKPMVRSSFVLDSWNILKRATGFK